jgi:hypothetical protein
LAEEGCEVARRGVPSSGQEGQRDTARKSFSSGAVLFEKSDGNGHPGGLDAFAHCAALCRMALMKELSYLHQNTLSRSQCMELSKFKDVGRYEIAELKTNSCEGHQANLVLRIRKPDGKLAKDVKIVMNALHQRDREHLSQKFDGATSLSMTGPGLPR